MQENTCPICLDPIDYCLGHGIMPDGECDICGERFTGSVHEEIGEFYEPSKPNTAHMIAHAQCGIDNHLELA